MSPATKIAVAIALTFALHTAQQQGCSVPSWLPVPNVVSEAKIDLPGVSALVVYQDADIASLTQQQRDVISGHLWTDKIAKGNWRSLDTNAEFTGPSPFRSVFERRPEQLPWAVISGPGVQYEGAMPSTAAEMAQLVEGAK